MGGTYDAILVPGAGVGAHGELPLWTQRRLHHALAQRQDASVIILSADTTHKPPPISHHPWMLMDTQFLNLLQQPPI